MAKAKQEKFNPGKSVLENLAAMSKQRNLAEVAAECDIAFCRSSKEIEGLEVINAPDPLRAALDYAAANDKTCLVHEHTWFTFVPSRKRDMRGWLNCLKIWETIDEQRRIAGQENEVTAR